MCHVGIDVGTNTTAPKILMERLGMGFDDAAFATSLYFIFRTAGCFLGSFILRKMSAKSFFGISVVMMLIAMIGLFIFHEKAIKMCIRDRRWGVAAETMNSYIGVEQNKRVYYRGARFVRGRDEYLSLIHI